MIVKSITRFLFAGVLLSALCAGFVACNEFETPEQTNEDPAGETTFFVKYSIAPPESEEQTARWNLPYDEAGTIILVINSDEELKKYVEGNYPPVDFLTSTTYFGV